MHVAFLCDEYPPGAHGGLGSLTQTLARRLVDSGHRATVIGTYRPTVDLPGDRVEDDGGVQVLRLTSRTGVRGLRAVVDQRHLWREVSRIHGTEPIDVVEGPEPAFWAAPKKLGFPTMVRMHGGHRFFAEAEGRSTRPGRRWVESASIRRADDLVAVSDYTAGRTVALLGLGDRPVAVIPNPVDVQVFRPLEQPVVAGTVLFLGTICEKKGVGQLVEGFPAVAAAVPGARLIIAGRDQIDPITGGSFTDRLRSSVPPELGDQVDFRGPVEHDRVAGLIAEADVCALPSHMEALPVAWIEVLASGKALVASSTGPGPEVVEHGVSGLLVDPRDPAAIATALIDVLTDRDLHDRLAAGARRRAVERFSVDDLIDVNLDHYRALSERWRSGRA